MLSPSTFRGRFVLRINTVLFCLHLSILIVLILRFPKLAKTLLRALKLGVRGGNLLLIGGQILDSLELSKLPQRISASVVRGVLNRLISLVLGLKVLALLQCFGLCGDSRSHWGNESISLIKIIFSLNFSNPLPLSCRALNTGVIGATLLVHLS